MALKPVFSATTCIMKVCFQSFFTQACGGPGPQVHPTPPHPDSPALQSAVGMQAESRLQSTSANFCPLTVLS